MPERVELLMTEIAQALYQELCDGDQLCTVRARMIDDYSEMNFDVIDAQGNEISIGPEMDYEPLFYALRVAMWEWNPEHGAWYTAQISVDANGEISSNLDYDDLTGFTIAPTEEEIAEDLRRFPRRADL